MSDITFRFVAIGQSDVRAAFKQTRDDAVEMEKAIKSLDRAQAQRSRAGSVTRSPMAASARDSDRVIKDVAKAALTSFNNDKKRIEQAAAKSEAAQTAIARQGMHDRIKASKQEFDSRLRARQDAFKKEQAISRDATRSELDAQRRSNAAAIKQKQYAYEADKVRKQERERGGMFSGLGSSVKGAVIGGVLTAGALGVGIAGAAGRDALRLREVSNRLSISSRGAGQDAVDPAILQKEFERTAANTPGQTAAGIAEAVQAFVTKTGRLDVARSQQGVFATVASATGGNVTDIGNAAADLFQKFDITTMEEMADAMAALTFQGKNGAFELKDAASQFGRMSAAAAAFGLEKGAKGVRTLGGLTQIARSATGSPEQAATAVEAMFRQLISQADNIEKKTGTKVFTDETRTKARDVQSVLAETIAGAKGDLPTLQKIFGDEGSRGIKPLISTFNEAQSAAKAGGVTSEAGQVAAGLAALKKALSDAIDAPGDYAELQRDAAQAQQDSSAKLTAAWERITSSVGESLIPVFTSLVGKLADSPEAIAAFTGSVEVAADALLAFIGFLEGILGKKILTPEKREEMARKEASKAAKEEAKVKASVDSKDNALALIKQGKTGEATSMLERLMDPEHAAAEATKVRRAEVNSEMARRGVNKELGFEKDVQKTRSLQEFQDYYASLGNQGLTGKDETARVERAKELAAKVAAKPLEFQGDRALSMGFGKEGETQEQAIARKAFAQNQGERRVQAGGSAVDPNGAQLAGSSAMMEAAKIMLEAAKQMSAQGNGSVVGKAP